MLVDVLPKDENGQIILDPAGKMGEETYAGTVNAEWFVNVFQVAIASVPLSDADFATLKGIDDFWGINAYKWREQGII